MISHLRRATLGLVLAALCSAPAVASAQTGDRPGYSEQRTDGGSSVVFDDDKALGKGLDPFADLIKGPPRATRLMLLRPRYNFVPEMLKSVENI